MNEGVELADDQGIDGSSEEMLMGQYFFARSKKRVAEMEVKRWD